MSSPRPTALIADDEPVLRRSLQRMLAQHWPELDVVALARNGREAIDQFEALKPDICFLDVHMPGLSGVEAARCINRRAHVVFVTAFDQYALQAFEQGAIDYLVKPLEPLRLADTVGRLQARLRSTQPIADSSDLLERLLEQLHRKRAPVAPLRWLRASVGQSVQLIPVEEVDYLRSDTKYTLVAWGACQGRPAESLIRTPLKEILPQLDSTQFSQVHRSVVVNMRAVSRVERLDGETANIHLKDRSEVLPVSRTYLHVFRQM